MNQYCCVPQCSSWIKRNPDLSFHLFPKAGKSKVFVETKLGSKELIDRRLLWIRTLKIGKDVSNTMKVCSLHFLESDFLQRVRVKRRTLKSFAVPSQNLPLGSCSTSPGPSSRALRKKQEQCPTKNSAICEPMEVNIENQQEEILNIDLEDQEAAEALLNLFNSVSSQPLQKSIEELCAGPSTRDTGVQVNTPKVLTLCELIMDSDEKLKNFTGVNNFKIFDAIVEIFKKYCKDKRSHRLSVKERLMLVLTKFKTNLTYVTLGTLFGISADLTKTYIYEIVPLLSKVLRPLIYFPPKREILNNMPISFENFQDVRVVLDCTEIHVQTPKCLCCRIRFYSQYKSHMTVKFMTAVSPGGLITFISKAYGGRTSDKVIFEESNIIALLDPNRDAVMVDKGFRIEDICSINKIKLIRPPFLKQKSQLSTEEAMLNAKIARARVHIEHSNGRLKIFNILKGTIPWNILPLVDDIFVIICAITNLSSPILANERFLSS